MSKNSCLTFILNKKDILYISFMHFFSYILQVRLCLPWLHVTDLESILFCSIGVKFFIFFSDFGPMSQTFLLIQILTLGG